MTTKGLLLIQGTGVKEENLKMSLGNAKQIVFGNSHGLGWVLQLEADNPDYFAKALLKFSQAPDVKAVLTLALRN